MDAKFSQLQHAEINGRNVWLYEIECPIGYVYIVESEDKQFMLHRSYESSLQTAEKRFETIVTKMVKGTL